MKVLNVISKMSDEDILNCLKQGAQVPHVLLGPRDIHMHIVVSIFWCLYL